MELVKELIHHVDHTNEGVPPSREDSDDIEEDLEENPNEVPTEDPIKGSNVSLTDSIAPAENRKIGFVLATTALVLVLVGVVMTYLFS